MLLHLEVLQIDQSQSAHTCLDMFGGAKADVVLIATKRDSARTGFSRALGRTSRQSTQLQRQVSRRGSRSQTRLVSTEASICVVVPAPLFQ